MSKFKKGDKIKVVSSERKSYWYSDKIGQEFILLGVDKSHGPFILENENLGRSFFAESDIKLVQEKEMFDTNFDMKSQPWFIRVNNMKEWSTVQKWLEDNFGSAVDCSYENNIKLVTNTDSSGEIWDTPMWGSDVETKKKQAQEIKIHFKTVIDSVQYPQVETEQDKKIRELRETIEKAQKQIEDIQKGMK